VIVLWFPLVSIPVSLPLVLLDTVRPSLVELGWLVGVGLFTQLGQIGLTHGLVRLSAARATSISYLQVVFAALWGWLLFGERLDPWTLAGAGLILSSILISQGRPRQGVGEAGRLTPTGQNEQEGAS
jgi:drug/metabolite transporter (DMT)-like permease